MRVVTTNIQTFKDIASQEDDSSTQLYTSIETSVRIVNLFNIITL